MSVATLNDTLSTQAFYVLLAIMDKTLYGYAVCDQIAHDSESRVILATGTVYTVLKRLVAQGLVERIDARGEKGGITYRYRITARGTERLKAEIARMQRSIADVRYKLGEAPYTRGHYD